MSKTIRIGGASGYWGDTAIGPVQLIRQGQVDYLIFDYLAEITMSILAKAQARDPALGYATDFIERVMAPLLPEIHRQGIKVIANAGGVNLTACRQALEKVAADAGLPLRIGTVEGDNLLPQVESVRALGPTELDTGAPLPAKLMSMNAYLGAFPIAAALDAGADIVLTGRCVDSALAVGPLIHEFGWRPDEYDRLAAGALVGHVIECGAQATGGNYSDWSDTVDGWDDTGFPVAEVSANGAFVLTKPRDTGGTVTPFTAGEQMLYEIGDPGAYVLPDVIADFRQVTLEQDGPDRVRIEGARGHAPTDTYKVSATYADGFGCVGTFVIAGRDAATKARRQGEAVLKKVRRLLDQSELGDFSKTAMQLVGAESSYGDHASDSARQVREVVLRLGVHHPRREGVELFSKEFVGAGLSMAPGITGLSPGRPRPTPIVRLFSFLIDKERVPVQVAVDGEPVSLAQAAERGGGRAVASQSDPAPALEDSAVKVPLYRLAVARSGDKGDHANIGVIARRPEYLPALRAALTEDAVAERFSHTLKGKVERFDLPGSHAMNFLLRHALDGGGVASLHLDAQAKTYAQVLLDMEIPVPEGLLSGS